MSVSRLDLFLLASDAPLLVPPHPDLLAAGWLGNEGFEPPASEVVLTDDRNPLDLKERTDRAAVAVVEPRRVARVRCGPTAWSPAAPPETCG